MNSYGPRVDPDGVVQHAPVSDAIDYGRPLPLWTRRVGTGRIVCELVRPNRSARRIVRLTATYMDGDTEVVAIANVTDEDDEHATVARLQQRMLAAQIRPSEGLHDQASQTARS
jgi:hypothetical protein